MDRSKLIYQEKYIPDSLVYDLRILEEEQNWAFLRHPQKNPEKEYDFPSQPGHSAGPGLIGYLCEKEMKLDLDGGADDEALSESAAIGIFEKLHGILDPDDKRVESLQRDGIRLISRLVKSFSHDLGLATDQYYSKAIQTYRDIRYDNYFSRESYVPQADLNESCREMHTIANANWQFGKMPGVFSRVSKLIREDQLLQEIQKKLSDMQPMELWNEPAEFMPQASENFFATINELLSQVTSKELSKMEPMYRIELENLQANAVQSIFGLAVQSGCYDMILQALETIQNFVQKSNKDNLNTIFQKCKPGLEIYLEQIRSVANKQKSYHVLNGNNVSAVFASSAKIYSNQDFFKNNTSITSDGSYIYLQLGFQSNKFKIGTGLNGTIAGHVYLNVRSRDQGYVTWVYCQGKLYLRKAGGTLGAVTVIDPNDFRVISEVILDLEDQFKEQNELFSKNQNYPLISDGEYLYAIVMTVEKRERRIKDEHKEKAQALKDYKQKKRTEQELQMEKEAEAKNKVKKEKLPKFEKNISLVDEVDFYHGQQYFVAVFKAIRFDLSKQRETKPKKPVEQDEIQEIDFLSMSEAQLFEMPIVNEMFETFSGFYNIKRCALALQHNNDDIHDAGQWLIDEKDKPFFVAHAKRMEEKLNQLSQPDKPKAGPPTIPVAKEFFLAESIIKSRWDECSKENPEIQVLECIMYPQCLECGKWTICGDQITYHTDNTLCENIANFVFRLDDEAITSRPALLEQQKELERCSIENSREQQQTSEFVRVPSAMRRQRGPLEEELPHELAERMREKLAQHDEEKTGNISVESLSIILEDLNLADEDEDANVMEEAFQGILDEDRDQLKHEEFGTIARRLYYRKKLEEDKKKMADITEEQIEEIFNKCKTFNQQREEDSLTERRCLDALQRLKIQMNPREYQKKFREYDANQDRHINFEEFRRFLGKEPRNDEKKVKSKKRRLKVHVSNQSFFWDGIEWHSFTPQEISEGIHTAAKESKRMEIAKTNAAQAEKYDWISEWKLYEELTYRTAVIHIDAEKGNQANKSKNYVTYDNKIGKFICFNLSHANNFFMVDSPGQMLPKTFAEAPPIKVQSMSVLTEVTLNLLSWVNERRFAMPWRWSLWSQTLKNVLRMVEENHQFLDEIYVDKDLAKEPIEGREEAKKASIKKIKKRIDLFVGREVTRELYRLNRPISENEQAIAYRAKKKQKERSKNAKKVSDNKPDESEIQAQNLEEHVLPLEKIVLAQECRKYYAYCTKGNLRVVSLLFDFLQAEPTNEVRHRAFFECILFADHLLAYHDQALMDRIRQYLMTLAAKEDTTPKIKQYIWRTLVVGWYKFACNADQQLDLLHFFVRESKPIAGRKQISNDLRWIDPLILASEELTPVELFNHRFFSTPASFYFFEMLQISKVTRYHVCLKSSELLDAQLVENEETKKKQKKEDLVPDKEAKDTEESRVSIAIDTINIILLLSMLENVSTFITIRHISHRTQCVLSAGQYQ